LGVKAVVSVAACALLVAPAALAGPSLRVGAAEDAAKWGNASAEMARAQQAGFDTVRLTEQWSAGQTAPPAAEASALQAAVAAAAARGIAPVVAVYNTGSSSTPSTPELQAQFAAFAAAVASSLPQVTTFIVGNEPNSNLYWLPQFDAAGNDVAAVAYEQLLASTYDAIKQVRPDASVVGGALESRGGDNPSGSKPTHSPTSFIRDLGAAYRASGRTKPIMDVFDQHVYADTSALPPSMAHPNTTTIAEADYGKLVALLGQAFDGTKQPGSTLPILYGEFGVESAVPAAKTGAYTGSEVAATVDEATQAAYYVQAFKLALCQPNVIGILDFHVVDESALGGWQSGVYYADGTAKSSLAAVRDAAAAARGGTLTTCPDTSVPKASITSASGGTIVTVTGTATDDVGVGRVELLANGAVVATKFAPPYTFTWKPTQDGIVTLTLRAADAAGNTGTATATVVVDVTPPETTITAQDGTGFTFAANEPATFACSLDGAAFAACTSPAGYAGLASGEHTFAVRATDAVGNVDASPATVAFTIAPPPAPAPAPAPAPSGGGGGGGGGLPPDLAVTLAADPSPLAAGSELIYRAAVTVANAGSSTGTVLTLQLPAGVEFVRSYASRGPGCTAGGGGLRCDLDWLSPPYAAQVIVWTIVRTPGELTASAAVGEEQTDVDPSSNTTSLTLSPPVVVAPATPPVRAAPLVRPRLTGRPVVGATLTAAPAGTWRVCTVVRCPVVARGTQLVVRRAWIGRRVTVTIGRVTLRTAPIRRRG
jgi:hypothetical protein